MSLAKKLGLPSAEGMDATDLPYLVLQSDARTSLLRRSISTPREVSEVAAEVFDDLPEARQEDSLATFVDLLTKTQDPKSGAPLLSARYHFFLRSLEGAFVTYSPTKRVHLERTAPPAKTWREHPVLLKLHCVVSAASTISLAGGNRGSYAKLFVTKEPMNSTSPFSDLLMKRVHPNWKSSKECRVSFAPGFA